ncbi:MAG: helix-turn-helix transcriptional regulator [Acidimicrobiales bacterium]|jgi:transcriptional regulator with XRE-family HTH domain
MVTTPIPPTSWAAMSFAERLAATRRHRELTQDALAERVGVHVSQIRRYEAGTSAPTLDVLRNLALALNVSTDSLVFDEGERGPDDELALTFEAITGLEPDERAHVQAVLEGLLLRHQARRITKAS